MNWDKGFLQYSLVVEFLIEVKKFRESVYNFIFLFYILELNIYIYFDELLNIVLRKLSYPDGILKLLLFVH